MTEREAETARMKKLLEMQKYRQKKKESSVQTSSTPSHENAFRSKSSEAKATKRVSKALPQSPRKKRAVFQKLAVALFPNQTVFKRINSKKPSILSEDVKENVQKFYCSDLISTQARGIRDRHILRDQNGKKLTDKNGKSKSIQK